jgi:hypothetical protein
MTQPFQLLVLLLAVPHFMMPCLAADSMLAL